MRPAILFLCSIIPLIAEDFMARFDLTVHRILAGGPPVFSDDFILADAAPHHVRRFTEFSGDVSGRYLDAFAAASIQTGRLFPSLDRLLTKVIQLQKPDGHFGGPMSTGEVTDSDFAILWGNGRMLAGLLECYQLDQRPDVLQSARLLGDFLVGVAPRFNDEQVRSKYNGPKFAVGYICWTNNLEGVVELYRVTRDDRYLALARQIAARIDRHPSQHSHGLLTTLRGVVALHRVTGERAYLEQAEAEWKGIIDSGNLFVQGAVPEMLAPESPRDEGCSESDWLRLSLELWQLTRRPEYLRQAQVTLFNEFSFNQFHTGDFGHHVFSPLGTEPRFARAWWCCTFHGLRAMAAAFAYAFSEKDGALLYDLPIDGRGRAPGFAVSADASLNRSSSVRLTVLEAGPRPHTFALRLPDWASEVTLSLAGRALPAQLRGEYVSLTRTWKTGEVVTATYRMRTRLVPHPKLADRAAIFYGPWLLAVDEAASPNYFDEPSNQNKVDLTVSAGDIKLQPAPPAAASTPFTVPVAHFKLRYLPAGYPVQPQFALLRPIAEFTAEPDSNRLEFWLPMAAKR
jgi:DUF1680 family protein